jgi:hypothetical protein
LPGACGFCMPGRSGREVRVVRLIARRRVPVGVSAFGAASVPRAPRARAGARSDRTLATRAAPGFPPLGRPQNATGAPCDARRHPSSSPLCRRARSWRLTALTTRAYRRRQTRASPKPMALRRPEAGKRAAATSRPRDGYGHSPNCWRALRRFSSGLQGFATGSTPSLGSTSGGRGSPPQFERPIRRGLERAQTQAAAGEGTA